MKRMLKMAAAAAAMWTAGCASIVSDDDYTVRVTSNPDGVPITVRDEDGQVVHRATTPFTMQVTTDEGYFAGMDYTLEGPNGGVVTMNSNLDEWYWGNLLFGGIIGFFIVDPATGSMWEFPESIHLNDEPIDISNVPPEKLKQPTQ